jgi:hypothetical protein
LRIIEFLLDNIFIVVIIFGALASFFGKAGSKKRPNQMPDFGGGGLPRMPFPQKNDKEPIDERRTVERPETQTIYRSRPDQERQTSASREGSVAVTAARAASIERPIPKAAEGKTKAGGTVDRQTANPSAMAASVQTDDIRKAIVWAEILGPPRSKRPYRK